MHRSLAAHRLPSQSGSGSDPPTASRGERAVSLGIGLVQSAVLHALAETSDQNVWPTTEPLVFSAARVLPYFRLNSRVHRTVLR